MAHGILLSQFHTGLTVWELALRALARATHRAATSSGKHPHVEWLSQGVFCGPAYVEWLAVGRCNATQGGVCRVVGVHERGLFF